MIEAGYTLDKRVASAYQAGMRIVLFLLKCLVGIFATIGFLMVAAAVASWLLWERVEPLRARVEPLPEAMVLTLDLAEGWVEVRPDNPLARASLGDALVLRDVLDTLEAAGADPKVRAILVRVGRGAPGLALIQELRDAILAFRAAGKLAIAFAETFGEAGNGTQTYYLASAFDRIWLQPSGDLDITGFSLQSPFLRGVLDDLRIVPRLDQRGAYKGAAAFLTEAALPEPQRANLQRLLDSSLDQIVQGVAAQRALDPAAVRGLIDSAPHQAAQAKEAGLIDRLGYWGEAEADALAGAEIAESVADDPFVALTDYARRRGAPAPEGPVVALIHGLGPVVLDHGENDPVFGSLTLGADTVAGALRDAAADDEVRAIVFRVDSPGGSYVASDTIWNEVRRARDSGTPVIVSMGGVAASGGYFMAAPATAIVAQPGTITGSIGVVTGKMVLSGLWDRLGVTWDGVSAGAQADIWNPNRDFTAAEWAEVQEALDRVYADFTGKVAAGRNLPLDKVIEAAEGRVWTGADALPIGLVDALGGYRKAFALAREAAGIDPEAPIQVRPFPEARDPFRALLEDAFGGMLEATGAGAAARGMARIVRVFAPFVEAVETITGGQEQAVRAPLRKGLN